MIVLATALILASCSLASAQTPNQAVQHFATPDGIEYGLWNATPETRAAPTLFVLASTIDTTLGKAYYRQCGNELAEHGWICVTIDLQGVRFGL